MAVPRILLTGRPGIGKTTALKRVVDMLRAAGFSVGGMLTLEVREGGVRVGFKVVALDTGEEAWLAHKSMFSGGPRVGRYNVNLEGLEKVGVAAIERAIASADVIAVDEIGPMELKSDKFKEVVAKALESEKPFIGTIHIRADRDPFARGVKARCKVYEVTLSNRAVLPRLVYEEVVKYLKA